MRSLSAKEIFWNGNLIRGLKLYEQMKDEIVKHLKVQPTLESIYSKVSSEDLMDKRIELMVAESGSRKD